MALELFQCARLSAAISERQCEINRNGYHNPKKGVHLAPIMSWQGCAGLGSRAQVTLPVEEKNMAKYLCMKHDCGRPVKKPGNFCWQHQGLADQVEAGAVSSHQEAAAEVGTGAVSDEAFAGASEAPAFAEASVEVVETVAASPEAVSASAAGPADAETAVGGAAGSDDAAAGELSTTGVTAEDGTGLLPGAITAEAVLKGATAAPGARKTLLSLIAPIEKAPLPPPGLYLDFTGHEDLLDWLREVSDDPNRDILALLSGVTRGEIYAPEDAAVRGE